MIRVRFQRMTLLLALQFCACTGGSPQRRSTPDPFATPAVQRARRVAGDLYMRAVRARQLAVVSEEPSERAAAARRAQLWLQAATLEAQRVEDERKRVELAARARRLRARGAELRRQLRSVQRTTRELVNRRRVAQAVGHLHASAWGTIYPAGSGSEERSGSGSRTASEPPPGMEETLRAQARLTLAAARLLARAAPAGTGGVEVDRLATVARKRAETALVSQDADARRVLVAAQAALGAERGRRPVADRAERQSLIAALGARSLDHRGDPDALRIPVPEDTFASGARPSSRGQVWLFQLDELLRLFPHGPVWLEMHVPATNKWPLASPRLWARGRRILRALRLHRKRVSIQRPIGNSGAPPALWVALPGYAPHAPRTFTRSGP